MISAKNSVLEQDFENEIGKKNQNSKEIGQIINSINNIFNICQIQQAKRGKKLAKPDGKVNEETENLVEELIASLDRAHQTVDELVQVHRAYGRDYDRERAYTEDIDAQIAAQARNTQAISGNRGPAQSTTGGHESTGMRTGKLNTSALSRAAGVGADTGLSNRTRSGR